MESKPETSVSDHQHIQKKLDIIQKMGKDRCLLTEIADSQKNGVGRALQTIQLSSFEKWEDHLFNVKKQYPGGGDSHLENRASYTPTKEGEAGY